MPAVLHDHTLGFFQLDDFQHVFQGQRLKIQSVGGVVIGGDGFRVAVDHDGLIANFAQRQSRVHAAIVELDALTNSIRATAQHHDLVAIGRVGLAFLFVARVHIGSIGTELGGAGVNPLVHRAHPESVAQGSNRGLVGAHQLGQTGIGKAFALEPPQTLCIESGKPGPCHLSLHGHQGFDLTQEPRINPGQAMHLFKAHTAAEGIGHVQDAIGARFAQFAFQCRLPFFAMQIKAGGVESDFAGFQPAQGLLQ